MIEVLPIPAFKDNYIWLIVNRPGTSSSTVPDHCAIVDPGDAHVVLKALSTYNLTPAAILITHHHHDHTGGLDLLLKTYDIPVYGPANEIIPAVNLPVCDADYVSLPHGLGTFLVMDIPGHTNGHIAYYGESILFCGDTLFAAGCGRLFEGTASQMYQSLNKIAALPLTTHVYCTHEYTLSNLRFAQEVEPHNQAITDRFNETKKCRAAGKASVPFILEIEKRTNPFLRCDNQAVLQAAEHYAGKPLQKPEDTFATLRRWKDVW